MEQHDEAVQNFCAFTGNWDVDIAIAYLSKNNWDVSAAYNDFMGFTQQRPPIVENRPQVVERSQRVERPQVVPVERESEGFFSWIGNSISNMFSGLFTTTPSSPFINYLENLQIQNRPNISLIPYEDACNIALNQNKLLLIYVHHAHTGDRFLRNVLCSSEIITLINQAYVFLAYLATSEEGSLTIARYSDDQAVVFVMIDPFTSEALEKLTLAPSKSQLRNFLINRIGDQSINDDVQKIQDRMIREQQERELREAEEIEIRKAEEESKRLLLVYEQRQAEERRIREEEEKKNKKERMIGEEPPAGPYVTQITFRLPSGEKLERRFLQDTKIDVLYLFLETKGFENIEIVSGFPPKVVRDGSLQSEGLIPRALMHVRLIQS
ncbi:hypothetical protein SteCoe_10730 [Stentor coeruleus]|uniref:UBX domain-containing protein n=1 Tax=Stentor coeruleus TaxID=5963 RepID=A0A1R2CEX7_9CILI|nr:hypothetical protein SteCoe_10730 [Stentor coeruleus]